MKLTEKQKDCKYCHKQDSFLNTDFAWEVLNGFMYGMWQQAFEEYSHDLLDIPHEMSHGLPSGNSMMVWREGHQAKTAILTHMWPDQESGSGKMAGDLIGPSNCPMCGRPLNEEENE